MGELASRPMTADEFLAWASDQEGGKYELAGGQVVAMAPERLEHTRIKSELWLALRNAIRDASLPCEAIADGMSVRVADDTVYEPDVLVRCGAPLAGTTLALADPVVVVEVLSPSTRGRDSGAKLEDYFRLPPVRHYVLVRTDVRSVIHHFRAADGQIRTNIHRGGAVSFDPPGIHIDLDAIFETLR
jgi:Uma2 family endonuclease